MISSEEILTYLHSQAEEKYRRFSAGLLPGEDKLLGVRLPILRKLARKMAADDWQNYRPGPAATFEELMLRGLLPSYAQAPLEVRLNALESYVPLIRNWSLCDSCCCSCRFVQDSPEQVQEWLQPFLYSEEEFPARFGIVMLLFHYLKKEEHAAAVAQHLPQLPARGYYAQMAIAWCTCELHFRYPELAAPLLNGKLRPELITLTRRKIRESGKTTR